MHAGCCACAKDICRASERISFPKGAAAVQVAALAGLLEAHGVDLSALLSRVCPLACRMYPCVALTCCAPALCLPSPHVHLWGSLPGEGETGWPNQACVHAREAMPCIADRAWRGPVSQCVGCVA